jgi:hypothetical protein
MEYKKDLHLFAPKSYWNAQVASLHKICNGCGPAGASVDLIPDKVWGINVADI